MQITNLHNLPDAIVRAVQNDPYDKGEGDYSVSDLVNPVRAVHLIRRHDSELTEDAADRIWSLLGQLGHLLLERAGNDNALEEERLYMIVDTAAGSRIIGSKADVYHGSGLLQDFKVTSAWTIVFKSRVQEWEDNLNLRALVLDINGWKVNKLEIVAVYRDWSRTQALRSAEYPQVPVQVIPLRIWPEETATALLNSRVSLLTQHESTPDAELPECTEAEMWEKPTKYAAMKTGRKSAVRVLDSEGDALAVVADGKATHVEVRPGARVRCESYCAAAPVCNQWQEWKPAEQSFGDKEEVE